jgi:metal-sulfur cluster biosynthetic enzyme
MTPTIIDEPTVRAVLRQVVDPEIDCNIVDLGLVYGIAIDGAKVTVTMTLTTRGCPMHESIAWGVKCALLNLEGVEEVDLQIVWDPPWTPDRLSSLGRERTGILGG